MPKTVIFQPKNDHFWPILAIFEGHGHLFAKKLPVESEKMTEHVSNMLQSDPKGCSEALEHILGIKVADFIRKIAKWTYFTLLPPSGSLCTTVHHNTCSRQKIN